MNIYLYMIWYTVTVVDFLPSPHIRMLLLLAVSIFFFFPRERPPHSRICKVVKVGSSPAAQTFAEGCIVGVGWHGDYCTTCEACTDGDFVSCENQTVCGLHMPGGYQE